MADTPASPPVAAPPPPAAPAAPAGPAPLPAPLPRPEPDAGTAEGRQIQLAERLIASGVDPERVRAAFAADGGDVELLDGRSAEDRAWDAEHQMSARVDTREMFFELPPSHVIPAEALPQFNADVRDLAAGLGLARNAGSDFCRSIVNAIRATAAEVDLEAAAEKHTASLASVIPDAAKLAEMTKEVIALIDEAGGDIANKKFLAALKPDGVLGRRPEVFLLLHARAAIIKSWKEGPR